MANEQQAIFWTEEGGPEWVRHEARHDSMLASIGDAVLAAAGLADGDRVLDIGCGFGTLSLAAAALAPRGHVVGVDISAPMIERAIARAAGTPGIAFMVDDAQTMHLDDDPFDVAVSRFGVMFFDDPVAAFRNIASMMSGEGRLAFSCWQSFAANPWMRLVADVLAPYLPEPFAVPSRRQPGAMAFADPDDVRQVLTDSGWRDVELADLQTPIVLGLGGVEAAVDQLIGSSVGRAVWPSIAEDDRPAALDTLRSEVESHADGGMVVYPGAAWIVTASVAR